MPHLYLRSHSPLNTVYANEDGQALYKVETHARISTISCVVPNNIPEKDGGATVSMQDRFAHLAEVEHNTIKSSVLRFAGKEYKTKEFFRKDGSGWGVYGRNRIFKGLDGQEYKWISESFNSKLVVNNEAQTFVARSHQRHLGIFGKGKPASLEISTAGEHMVQEILITFIYVEKLRKDSETATLS
ncbi:hypothetical protein FPV67DRAFT_1510493 [Lyophyllum atratum]|nr:hypothetical protein FPV67DRAFT_1510493 [Lyophyllum atratum]